MNTTSRCRLQIKISRYSNIINLNDIWTPILKGRFNGLTRLTWLCRYALYFLKSIHQDKGWISDEDPVPTILKSRRLRQRWLLLYTLVRNPELVEYRRQEPPPEKEAKVGAFTRIKSAVKDAIRKRSASSTSKQRGSSASNEDVIDDDVSREDVIDDDVSEEDVIDDDVAKEDVIGDDDRGRVALVDTMTGEVTYNRKDLGNGHVSSEKPGDLWGLNEGYEDEDKMCKL